MSTLLAHLYLTLEGVDNRPWIVGMDIRLTMMIVWKDTRPNLISTDIHSLAADVEPLVFLAWATCLHNQQTLFLHTVGTVRSLHCIHTIINICAIISKYLTLALLAP